jgi:hypothetical protein
MGLDFSSKPMKIVNASAWIKMMLERIIVRAKRSLRSLFRGQYFIRIYLSLPFAD